MKKKLAIVLSLVMLCVSLPLNVRAEAYDVQPDDPEYDKYFGETSAESEEEEEVLSQGAYGSSYVCGWDGVTYNYPAAVDGASVSYGVDVSYYQGNINWPALKASGVSFAFIRVGYRGKSDGGLHEDSMFRTNIEGAYAAGVRVGVYIYSQAMNEAEAVEEAQYVQSLIAGYRGMISMPVMMDYETGSNSRLANQFAAEEAAGLDYKSIHTGVVNAFCNSMSAAGYKTGVYSGKNILNNKLNVSGIGGSYYIWMANYQTTSTTYSQRLNCWQYSSSFTGFAGYLANNNSEGKIDVDFWYGAFPTEYAPVDSATATAFVTRLYQVVLQRQPDPTGLSDWVSQLEQGRNSGAGVAQGFYLSAEMKNAGLSNADYVERVYLGMLGRSSDPTGKAEWVSALDSGASYAYVVRGFVGSNEFTNLCAQSNIPRGYVGTTEARDVNVGTTSFVSRLYTKALGRGYDVSGLNDWCSRINSNPSRSNILWVSTTGFLNSQEFLNKNLSNDEYVKVLYRTYLNREYDQAGLDDWVGRLNSGVSRDDVAAGFAYSIEFDGIMASYGL